MSDEKGKKEIDMNRLQEREWERDSEKWIDVPNSSGV
jgi:hypothetical protein